MSKNFKKTLTMMSAAAFRRLALTVSALTLGAGFFFPAQAEESGVAEIIVTARQRSENLLSIPVSVIALDAIRLERTRTDGIVSLAARAPGLAVSDPFGRFNPAPAMRGLSQPGVGDEPSVGFFIDGVYVSGRSGINAFFPDLERIEVLKGPQNALFGRNTFGGAVHFITRKPSNEAEASVELGAGTKEQREAYATVNVPLVPGKLMGRVNFSFKDFGGFYENALADGPEIGSEQSSAAALTLRATPVDRLETILRLSYGEDRDGQPKGYYIPTNCERRNGTGAFAQFCGEIPESDGPFAANDAHFGFRRDALRTALHVNYQMDAATLSLIAAYNDEDNEFNRDDDYSAALISRAGQLTERRDISSEARLVSADTGGPLSWLLGASYYRFDNDTERRNIQFFLGQTQPNGPVTSAETRSSAAYGSASMELLPGLAATGELRWQRDEKNFATTSRNAAGQPIRLKDGWTMWTPRFQLAYTAQTGTLLYASVAKGAKSGGFNDMANLFDAERSFRPERNWTYEVGAKAALADGRLAVTGALFYIDWLDQQVVAASAAGAINNFYTNNAGKSRSQGFEAQIEAEPMHGLRLSGGYAFVDAEFRDYADPDYVNIPAFAPTGRIDGKALPRQSKHQFALSGDYQCSLGDDATLVPFMGGEWLWQSRQFTENSNLSFIPSDSKVNLWAGFDYGRYRVTARVRNLFDDRSPPVAIRFSRPTATGIVRAWLATPGDGRTFSLSARAAF
jgi:iron complex outermembrane recepter protein